MPADPTTSLGVKLRIFGGYAAPTSGGEFQTGGAPFTVVTKGCPAPTANGGPSAYRTAWSSFQHALAAHYDSNPLVRAVSVGSCATLTGEPFVTNLSPPAVTVMEAAEM